MFHEFYKLLKELLDLWSLWWSGTAIESATVLWGKPLFVWGRVGKVIQFFSALMIIAEIIGPERIRDFGKFLRSQSSFRSVQGIMRKLLGAFTSLLNRQAKSEDTSVGDIGLDGTVSIENVRAVSLMALWGGLAAFVTSLSAGEGFRESALFIPIAYFFLSVLVVFLGLMFVLVSLCGIGLILDVVLLEPLAGLLNKPFLGKFLKIVSVVLLIIGFHFDLLSS